MTNLAPLDEPDLFALRVTDDEVGMRLDQFLAQHFPQHSRVRLRQLIQTSAVQVDQRTRKAAYRLSAGQLVHVALPALDRPGPEPENIPLEILFEDDVLVAINKPIGMVVHPAKGHWSGTLTAALAYHFHQLSQIGGPARPGIVHRLDRDTSGVMVVAKTDDVHQGLALQFEKRQVRKEYFAICHGTLDRDRDEINVPIGVHPQHREKMAVRSGHSSSRTASTFVEVGQRFRGFLSLHVFPKTGRTHQIRVHLSHIGCPIACDPLYTGHRILTRGDLVQGRPDQQIVLDRLALHAHRLSLRHPQTGKLLEFEAPLPDALQRFLSALETYRAS
jgi:23S rRNA pseudouridine1911/1915/1917 synthase